MYIFNDREYYVQKSLDNKLFEEKMKKSLMPLLPSIYIDENFNVLNFIGNNDCSFFEIQGDNKSLKYASHLRKHYSLELVSNKGTFKILSGYARESNFFKEHQECLIVHTKSLALFNKIRNEKQWKNHIKT